MHPNLKQANPKTNTLRRSLYLTSSVIHYDEVYCITIQNEQNETKFLFGGE